MSRRTEHGKWQRECATQRSPPHHGNNRHRYNSNYLKEMLKIPTTEHPASVILNPHYANASYQKLQSKNQELVGTTDLRQDAGQRALNYGKGHRSKFCILLYAGYNYYNTLSACIYRKSHIIPNQESLARAHSVDLRPAKCGCSIMYFSATLYNMILIQQVYIITFVEQKLE